MIVCHHCCKAVNLCCCLGGPPFGCSPTQINDLMNLIVIMNISAPTMCVLVCNSSQHICISPACWLTFLIQERWWNTFTPCKHFWNVLAVRTVFMASKHVIINQEWQSIWGKWVDKKLWWCPVRCQTRMYFSRTFGILSGNNILS